MTDPKRWSDDVELTDCLEQQLVRSAQSVHMPDADKQVAWNRLLSALPAALAQPSLGSPSAGTATGSWHAIGSAKALWLALGVCGSIVAGYPLVHHLYTQRTQAIQQSGAVPARANAAASLQEVTPNVIVSAAPSGSLAPVSSDVAAPGALNKAEVRPAQTGASAAATASPAAPISQLSEENRALLQARQALRSNDPAGALGLLEQSQKRFPRGALAEEREALTIEALARLGDTARSATRATAFLRNYPRSPHAADVRRYVAR